MISIWLDTGYFGQQPEDNSYGFGYFLDPAARGRGLIADCLRALMAAALDSVTVSSFVAFCEDDNKPSISVLERQGFVSTDVVYTEPNTGWTERQYRKIVTA